MTTEDIVDLFKGMTIAEGYHQWLGESVAVVILAFR
jgi:hypothetical protein